VVLGIWTKRIDWEAPGLCFIRRVVSNQGLSSNRAWNIKKSSATTKWCIQQRCSPFDERWRHQPCTSQFEQV